MRLGGHGDVIREALQRSGSLRLHGLGRSMWPYLRSGDEIVVVPLDHPPIPGDVILAELPTGSVVVHRVVRADRTSIHLRGDFNAADDPPIAPSAVIGVVAERWRNGRRLSDGVLERFSGLAIRASVPTVVAGVPLVRPVGKAAAAVLTGPLGALTARLLPSGRVERVEALGLREYLRGRAKQARLFPSYPQRLEVAVVRGEAAVFVVRARWRIVGWAEVGPPTLYGRDVGPLCLVGPSVRPLYRRRGLATALLEAAVSFARGCGAEQLVGTARRGDAGAGRLCERFGAHRVFAPVERASTEVEVRIQLTPGGD